MSFFTLLVKLLFTIIFQSVNFWNNCSTNYLYTEEEIIELHFDGYYSSTQVAHLQYICTVYVSMITCFATCLVQ